ncbi:penicillin-binding protein activator LpoB [Marinobacterium arenosum]|uniref:penicillin-binding protein activator LpoB n=1 Tax=Marinobacterium arenosum TaxID=2862496 RepID=UPI001C95F424|nr:penicillin-binding protein activator LpoB [Marinobacterium arenosum]MBY4675524.1 penicillin-binding protein activator LpoB [Marinobacterium arenosum]
MNKQAVGYLNKSGKALGLALMMALSVGCAPKTQMLNQVQADEITTAGLTNTDFEQAAGEAVQSMLRSGAVDRSDGKKNILVISSILNDTMQRLDTDQLVKKIRVELLQSGKVKTTTAIGLNGAEDQMNTKYAQLSQSSKVNQKTVVRQRFTAPNLSLSGKIIQRNNRLESDRELVEYYFQLTLTDLSDGLAVWEGETPIRKLTGANTVSW